MGTFCIYIYIKEFDSDQLIQIFISSTAISLSSGEKKNLIFNRFQKLSKNMAILSFIFYLLKKA